ncbi:MAG: LlaJI family restriction endonuclease [Spirochaetales bacterium]|nr:LlaJI family restriction endonuclease [Spirochaetales bacterium]
MIKHKFDLNSAYFREARTCYMLEDFNKKLRLNDIDKAKKVVAALKRTGIAKAINKKEFDLNNLNEEESNYIITDDISTNSDIGYVLNYVGFAYTENCLIKCYPKYANFDKSDDESKIESHFKKVLKVIRKLNTKEQQIFLYNGHEDSKSFNRLAVALYLIDDYYQNGIYSNIQTIIETNGAGEIDWDKTINETFAIIKRNTPYYVKLQTINTQSNELDYFKMLHECVLTICSKELEKAGILDLFDINPIELTGMKLDEFGDTEYIKYRLKKEIQSQFVTKKQTLLKTLYTFISESKSNENNNSVSLFGTNAFNNIWEKVCSNVFENQLNIKFKDFKKDGLISEYPHNPNYNPEEPEADDLLMKPNDKLIDLIEKSKWKINGDILKTQDTLIPDIISIEKANNAFIILDAKYYYIETDNTKKFIYHQPGIQDVVKQYAYNNAYHDFIFDCNFEKVGNAFLIPEKTYLRNEDSIKVIGEVTLNLMQGYSFEPLAPIQVIELNPDFLFEHYLNNKKLVTNLIQEKTQFNYKIVKRKLYSFGNSKNTDSILTGYIRPEYFNALYEKQSKDFIFYFYARKDNVEYELHPEILNCKTFIGYTDRKDKVIVGEPTLTIHKIGAAELKKALNEFNYNPTADSYYCISISNIHFESYLHYKEKFGTVDNYAFNQHLRTHAPKVI